jgi:FHA domain-containing protein
MAQDRGLGGRKATRAPLPQRSRKRWSVAGGVVAVWLVLYLIAGSVLSATVLLVAFAATGAIAAFVLRSMGVTRDHPRIRQLASRPWRDGQAVLQVAMSHLHDVFVITPSGSLFAPTSVEIQMNPEDLASLCDRIELSVVIASVTEAYTDQVARYGARFATSERAEAYVAADERIPRGRYRLRQGRPATAAAQHEMPDASYYMSPESEFAYAAPRYADDGSDGWVWREHEPALTTVDARAAVDDGALTVLEKTTAPPVPVLRLVTGDSVAQTQMTGARAGRGSVELVLPNVPTISREHARFEFSEGRWWVTNLGMNGLAVNGAPVETEHPLSDGDAIRWGSRPDALVSRVEIG